ncbi:MAG TPA: Do family serine endopeptidase [Phenylobacterium sp.]|uniref:Do family serine endopeptidase n=1 Tax=Phenylobacterium sp. TaxID=1871053 RepID=UPI002B477274|nr:Do family serine endopeptidase [Phenylobacterium sp.]HKR90290.1 Do family serine endopeptidase [Phenylobacterium sp.]
MRAHRVLIPAIVLLAACSPSGDGRAQTSLPPPTRTPPPNAAAMKMSFAPVVKKAAPAVVNISSKRLVRQQVDPFWQMFGLGAPRNRIEGSLGSGVIVRPDGVIVTNNHVVEGGQEITVALADRREFPAKVLLADPRTDLAVLKIDVGAEKLPVLAINDTADTQVGDLVLAIGDPFGVGQTVTNGIISALNRTADPSGDAASSYIQTDAPINPGNSGGALVDINGDLIGINSFILSRSGTSSGVGFAIPGALVRRVVETAVGGGHTLVRPWLGARLQSVTPEIARSLGLATPSGALVAEIWPGGSADRAGLRQGDVIVSVGGQPAVDAASVGYAFGTRRVGDTVSLGVRRDGKDQTFNARAQAAPATPPRDEQVIGGRNPLTGATVVNLSPAVADELGVDTFAKGVLVTKIAGGPAAAVGLQPGDIVRAVNGQQIRTTADLVAATGHRAAAWQVTIERGGQQITATFQ